MAIKTATINGVATIEIARPEKKNAITGAMYTALADAFDAAREDNAVRAILLTGQAEDEPVQGTIGPKRADDQTADLGRYLEQRRRNALVIFRTPRLALNRDALHVLIDSGERSNDDVALPLPLPLLSEGRTARPGSMGTEVGRRARS